MKNAFILAAIILFASFAKGQQVVDVTNTNYKLGGDGQALADVNGLIFSPVKFVRITAGTPFFREDWMMGSVVLDGGKALQNVWLRLNLLDNEVNYKDSAGKEMVSTSPIKYLSLADASGAKYEFALGDRMKNIDKSLAKTWFQVLVNDKASLCMQISKRLHEEIPYGTATTEQDILTINFYYLQMNNNFTRFKWEDWQEQFKDKKDMVSAFIRTNHLKGKNSEEYTKLVKYYNSL